MTRHHRRLPSRRRGQRGFTLIETCCAAVVLAVAITGLSNIAANSAAVHQSALQKEAALHALEVELATIVATPLANIPAFDGVGFTVRLEGFAGAALAPQAGDGDGQPGFVTVTAPTGDAAELVEVVVGVTWQSPHGPQTVTRLLRISRLGSGG